MPSQAVNEGPRGFAQAFLPDSTGKTQWIFSRPNAPKRKLLYGFAQDAREASCSPTCLPPGSWPARGSTLSDASSSGPEDTTENHRTITTTASTHPRQAFMRRRVTASIPIHYYYHRHNGYCKRKQNPTKSHPMARLGQHASIGNGVTVGTGAKILGNITVGEDCRVGAGSVVLRNVPANSTEVVLPQPVRQVMGPHRMQPAVTKQDLKVGASRRIVLEDGGHILPNRPNEADHEARRTLERRPADGRGQSRWPSRVLHKLPVRCVGQTVLSRRHPRMDG